MYVEGERNMKRRLLAILLTLCMLMALLPATALADGAASGDVIAVHLYFTYSYEKDGQKKTGVYKSNGPYKCDSLKAAFEFLAGRTYKDTVLERVDGKFVRNEYDCTIMPTEPVTIIIPNESGPVNVAETIEKKVVITGDEDYTDETAYVIYNTNSVTIQTSYKRTGSVTFSGGMEIQSGAKLTLPAGVGTSTGTMNYTFGDDLVVNGTLTVNEDDKYRHMITMNFGSNSMEIGEKGTVVLDNAIITGSPASDSALITNNGALTITQGNHDGDDAQPSITATDGPAIQNNGTLDISCPTAYGDLKITSNSGPAIIVAENAELELVSERVTISTENTDEQAIDLAPGSTVKVGDAVVTVGNGEGESYVDNDGVIHLAANSKVDDEVLASGGTVDTEGNVTPNTVDVESVSLDKNALTLNPSQTAQLTATVSPDTADKTVTWTSSNEAVATVDQSGNVTAMGVGTATITAKAGEREATCTVTVAYPYIPVPPVTPTQPTKPTEPDQPEEPDTPVIPGALPFVDVSANDWFYEDVAYVYAQGIMTGSTATSFTPNDAMTRAMVWTVLGRMDGASVEGGTPWYALAQSWAVSSNVSDGTGPNDSITREQLVTMLYRQAGSPEVGVSELALLGRFTDGETVSAWAEEPMAWAVSQGVLTGDGDLLNPQAAATRAQVAAILARYCANSGK